MSDDPEPTSQKPPAAAPASSLEKAVALLLGRFARGGDVAVDVCCSSRDVIFISVAMPRGSYLPSMATALELAHLEDLANAHCRREVDRTDVLCDPADRLATAVLYLRAQAEAER